MPIVALDGEQGGETVLALVSREPAQSPSRDEELGHRPDCELSLRSQIHLGGLSPILRLAIATFEKITPSLVAPYWGKVVLRLVSAPTAAIPHLFFQP